MLKYPLRTKVPAADHDELCEIGKKDLATDIRYNSFDPPTGGTARFFNDAGRFTQPDPLRAKYPNISPYVRVANNPLIYTDPTGTIIEFQNEDEALKTAEEINSLHNNETNITVTSSERTSIDIMGTIKNIFSGNFSIATKTQTVYQLSTSKSSFDWGQNEYTSALYDVINTNEKTYNVSLTNMNPVRNNQSMELYGGGFTDSYKGGANIYLDPQGNIRDDESFGIVFMHEVVGHGHPVTGVEYQGNAFRVNAAYGGRYKRGHAGYNDIIGQWQSLHLYRK